MAKLCDLCGRPYYRRSLTETWDRQNAGHRTGWHKAVIKACTNCVNERQAQRVMILATVRAVAPIRQPSVKARTARFLAALERARQQLPRRAVAG